MNHAIVYSSRTGNTALLAETVREILPDPVYFGAPDPRALSAQRIYVGFWTDRGSCDSDTAAFLETLTDQEVFLFGTAGFGGHPGYFEGILEKTKAHLAPGVRVLGGWICQGKMPMAVRHRYEAMQKTGDAKAEAMIANFDRALSHPDSRDLDALRETIRNSI